MRRFFVKYQDRILYGTDLTEDPPSASERAQNPPMNVGQFSKEADGFWRSDWIYLATPGRQHIDAINADVEGLVLPRAASSTRSTTPMRGGSSDCPRARLCVADSRTAAGVLDQIRKTSYAEGVRQTLAALESKRSPGTGADLASAH